MASSVAVRWPRLSFVPWLFRIVVTNRVALPCIACGARRRRTNAVLERSLPVRERWKCVWYRRWEMAFRCMQTQADDAQCTVFRRELREQVRARFQGDLARTNRTLAKVGDVFRRISSHVGTEEHARERLGYHAKVRTVRISKRLIWSAP
jgi:hypothetical protein